MKKNATRNAHVIMKTFYVLSREFNDNTFYLTTIKAKNESKAWQKVENEIQTNISQDWLMDKKAFLHLKGMLMQAKR